jgi:hypothetical protein
MKTGKYIVLGHYGNIKLGYGTVDYKNLKTIYIKLNSWLEPSDENDVDYEKLVSKTTRKIKILLSNLNSEYFKKESIVDLDIRTKGIKLDKKSFMSLEITLFVEKQFDVKSKDIKKLIRTISEEVVDSELNDKILFNFHKNKE